MGVVYMLNVHCTDDANVYVNTCRLLQSHEWREYILLYCIRELLEAHA